jgi:hypothetical protein
MAFAIVSPDHPDSPVTGIGSVSPGRLVTFVDIFHSLVGQTEVNGINGTELCTDTALLTEIDEYGSFVFDQSHDLRGTAFDTNPASVALKYIYSGYHFFLLDLFKFSFPF